MMNLIKIKACWWKLLAVEILFVKHQKKNSSFTEWLKFFRQQTHPLYLYVFDLWFSKKEYVHVKNEENSEPLYTHTHTPKFN